MEIFGIPLQAMMGQLLLGLVNGSFYAMLSLGLAVIFGLLNVINFAHGALYMMGAFLAWMGMEYAGINYWWMLIVAPLIVGIVGVVIERTMLRWLYKLDHLYGLLLTFGITLMLEGIFRSVYGVSGQPYSVPEALSGATNLGFMILPNYRAWVVVASLVVCFATWFVIEKTKLGAYLRAGTENPKLVEAFGVNVPLMVTLTYGFGVALAAFAGVLAAPVIQVSPLMGSNLIITVFAAAAIGLVMGLLAIRRQGIYFTMITLALAQMLYFVFLQAKFTGGEDGLQGVPRGKFFGADLSSDMTMYYVVLAICVAGFALIVRTIHSPFGQVLKAIKENEPRAVSLGYDVDKYKLLGFVLSAAIAGLAGATKTVVIGFETLTDAHWAMSGLVVLMTLVGGLGTMVGPMVGAVVIIALEDKLGDIGTWLADVSHIEWFRTLGDSVTLVTGFIFIVCVLLFRRGIVGELSALFGAKRRAA